MLTLNNPLNANATFGTATAVKLYADANAVSLTNGAKSDVLAAASGATLVDKIKASLASTDPVVIKTGTTDTIEVTFDENITFNNAVANDLVVKVNGEALDFVAGDYTVADGTADDAKFEIKVLKGGITAASDVTVELKDGRYVLDQATTPNRANAFAATSLKSGQTLTEQTAPTVSSAEVTGTTLTITFSEDLAGTVADPAAFAVQVARASVTVNSATVSGKTVVLTLASAPTTGQAVTVAYTASGTNNVKDKAGNALANFTAQAVTNNN